MKTGIYWQDPKYALKPGRDFIFDPSLVLYVPLYQLDGASFMSKDGYGHLCTVTGAVWTPRGRSFDGVDDVIGTPDHDSLDLIKAFTIEAWVKANTAGGGNQIITTKTGNWGSPNNYNLSIAGGKPRINYYDGAANREVYGNAITFDVWQQFVGTWDGTYLRIYKNGVLENTSPDFSATPPPANNEPVRIGHLGTKEGYDYYWFNGLIGEVRVYNRALTPLEIQRNYLATKWRYQ